MVEGFEREWHTRKQFKIFRLQNTKLTYTCAWWRRGRSTTSRCASECGRSGNRSGGTECASCSGAYRTTEYPWSVNMTSEKRERVRFQWAIGTKMSGNKRIARIGVKKSIKMTDELSKMDNEPW
jgi:hypothetical protein